MIIKTSLLLIPSFFLLSTSVNATVIYQNDFESGNVTGLTSSKTGSNQIGSDINGLHFLGLFGDYAPVVGSTGSYFWGDYFNWNTDSSNASNWVGDIVTLDLGNIVAGNYTVSFDFYAINTWDGGGQDGPDTFSFKINDTSLFSSWFASNGTNSGGYVPQASELKFSDQYDQTGNGNIGSNKFSFSYDFNHLGGVMAFNFIGIPNQPDQTCGTSNFPDEPWALDNVMVSKNSVAPVPEPATMLLFGTGLVGLAAVRRKKAC